MAGEIGLGVTISADSGAESADVDMGKLRSITIPSADFAKVDCTYLGQGSNIKSYIVGMGDPQDIDCEFIYEQSSFENLVTLLGVTHNFTVTFTSGQTFDFPGFVKNDSVEVGSAEDLKTFKCIIAVTGAIVVDD